MNNVFSFLWMMLENNYFVLAMYVLALIGKIIIFSTIAARGYIKQKINHPSFFLLLTLFSAAFIDIVWIMLLSNRLELFVLNSQYGTFYARLAWAFFVIQYHAMVFLLITLITRDYKAVIRNDRFCLFISSFFILFFTIFSVAAWNLFEKGQRPSYEFLMKNVCTIYLLLFLMPLSLWRTVRYQNATYLPLIIRNQYKTLISFFVLPYFITDFINMNPLHADCFSFVIQSQAFTGVLTLILTYLLYFCMRRILNIRFLSHELPRVRRSYNDGYDDHQRAFLSLVDGAVQEHEVLKAAQLFVARILSIEPERMHIFVRHHTLEEKKDTTPPVVPLMHSIELQLGMYGNDFMTYLSQEKYLFFDDVDFMNCYEPKPERAHALELLKSTGSTVFIPLLVRSELSGYIVVKKNEKEEDRLYDAVDRDRLISCAAHTALVVAHMREKEKQSVYEKNKALTAALVHADQRITHLREMVQTFLHPAQSKQVALFCYKSRQFFPAHKDAEKVLGINLNTDVGHETTQACMQLIQQVQEFRSRQSTIVNSVDGKRFLVIAFLESEQKHIFILITSCDLADIVSTHLGQLSSMNEWDYLLSLQTTKLGEKLNAFLPGRTKGLVQLKVALFQKIEQKQALFLVCDTEDVPLVAHLVHEATKRAHNVEIIDPLVHHEYLLKIFGKSWPYGMAQGDEPLLKSLDGGTLCIANSHALSKDAQLRLVDYLKGGQFKKIGGTAVCTSDVHLIFMAPHALYNEHNESPGSLFALAEKQQVIIPSPTTMEEEDVRALIEGYSMQTLRADIKTPLFMLSEHDIRKIVAHHPASLTELKTRIFNVLRMKNKDTAPDTSFIFDPAFLLVDQTLATAARLGKNALKQKHIMAVLWLRFEKNQNAIAKFLGVERSSVHRRVKQYGFT